MDCLPGLFMDYQESLTILSWIVSLDCSRLSHHSPTILSWIIKTVQDYLIILLPFSSFSMIVQDSLMDSLRNLNELFIFLQVISSYSFHSPRIVQDSSTKSQIISDHLLIPHHIYTSFINIPCITHAWIIPDHLIISSSHHLPDHFRSFHCLPRFLSIIYHSHHILPLFKRFSMTVHGCSLLKNIPFLSL
jgi:hypothetical protein